MLLSVSEVSTIKRKRSTIIWKLFQVVREINVQFNLGKRKFGKFLAYLKKFLEYFRELFKFVVSFPCFRAYFSSASPQMVWTSSMLFHSFRLPVIPSSFSPFLQQFRLLIEWGMCPGFRVIKSLTRLFSIFPFF